MCPIIAKELYSLLNQYYNMIQLYLENMILGYFTSWWHFANRICRLLLHSDKVQTLDIVIRNYNVFYYENDTDSIQWSNLKVKNPSQFSFFFMSYVKYDMWQRISKICFLLPTKENYMLRHSAPFASIWWLSSRGIVIA